LLTANSVFDRVFFANSGAEANEGAIKLARKWGKKNPAADGSARFEIITFNTASTAVPWPPCRPAARPAGTPCSPRRCRASQGHPERPGSVEKLIGTTVAVMLEPVQGEGGVIPATKEFMQACAPDQGKPAADRR
jgi:acetylornithine/N-succinyldiaminopimelate aminotransferase